MAPHLFSYIEIYIHGTRRSSTRDMFHIPRMAYAIKFTSNLSISLSYSLPLYIDFTNQSNNFLQIFFLSKIGPFLLRQISETLFRITEKRTYHNRNRLFLYICKFHKFYLLTFFVSGHSYVNRTPFPNSDFSSCVLPSFDTSFVMIIFLSHPPRTIMTPL